MKIFAPLGTQKFPFTRLLNELDEMSDSHEILVQSACNEKDHRLCVRQTIPYNEFKLLIEEADLVICHGGVNTIISRMKTGKPLIIVPRIAEYGEHIDNHQLEIAERLHNTFGVIVAEPESIKELVAEAMTANYKRWTDTKSGLGDTIRGLIR